MVWLLEASPAAREDRDPLQAMLWCFLDARTQACRLAEEVGSFGCCRDYQRWGERSVAPRAEWRALVDFWVSGKCVWRLELGCGGLCWKVADGSDFGQKLA